MRVIVASPIIFVTLWVALHITMVYIHEHVAPEVSYEVPRIERTQPSAAREGGRHHSNGPDAVSSAKPDAEPW